MYECMNVWMYECVNEWMYECMNVWMNEWMNVWMNEWMNVWMYECMNVWMYVWMNECMNEYMNVWIHEHLSICAIPPSCLQSSPISSLCVHVPSTLSCILRVHLYPPGLAGSCIQTESTVTMLPTPGSISGTFNTVGAKK